MSIINAETQITDVVELNGAVGTKDLIGATIRYSSQVGRNKSLVEEDHHRGKVVIAEKEKVRLVIPNK